MELLLWILKAALIVIVAVPAICVGIIIFILMMLAAGLIVVAIGEFIGGRNED